MGDYVQLSCNLSPRTAESFRELIGRKDIKINEGARRAIAIWRFVEDEIAAGNRLAVIEPGGAIRKVVLVDDDPVPACRVCGCTEDQACDGGCHWVDDPQMGDLCSRCVNAALKATVVDLVDGETETVVVPKGDYLLTTTEPCHRHHVQVAGTTHVVTIKGVRRG